MRFSTWIPAQAIGLCLLGAQSVPAPLHPFEAVPEPRQFSTARPSGPAIQAVEFRGAKRIPQFTLRALVVSRAGDVYDVETLQRDTRALYATRRFSHVVWEAEPGPAGPVVRFVLVERPLIDSLQYQGDNSVTMEEILERFQQRKIGLRTDTLLDEDELGRAASVVQELLGERGRRNVTVTALVERIGPPSIARITFQAAEKSSVTPR